MFLHFLEEARALPQSKSRKGLEKLFDVSFPLAILILTKNILVNISTSYKVQKTCLPGVFTSYLRNPHWLFLDEENTFAFQWSRPVKDNLYY